MVGVQDLNLRLLRPERSYLAKLLDELLTVEGRLRLLRNGSRLYGRCLLPQQFRKSTAASPAASTGSRLIERSAHFLASRMPPDRQ